MITSTASTRNVTGGEGSAHSGVAQENQPVLTEILRQQLRRFSDEKWEKVEGMALINMYKDMVVEDFEITASADKESTIDAAVTTTKQSISGSSELLIISGPIGSGKRHLARRLRSQVKADGGYYLTCKFDQLQRAEPYGAFITAYADMMSSVIDRGVDEMKRIVDAIDRSIGLDACILIEAIPALERILAISANAPASSSSSSLSRMRMGRTVRKGDTVQRFIFVFRLFVRLVSSPQHPVVLVMEDLHYADPCSLDLLGSILTDQVYNEINIDSKKIGGLILVATIDNGRMATVSAKLRELDSPSSRVKVSTINVTHPEETDVSMMLAHVLHDTVESEVGSLAKLIYAQTKGNQFHLVEFMNWMEDSNFIESHRSDGSSWALDTGRVMSDVAVTHDIVDLLRVKFDRLTHDTREMLKVAACLGFEVKKELLEYVLCCPVDGMIAEALTKNILVTVDNDITAHDDDDEDDGGIARRITFAHDRFQEAAYRKIPLDGRQLFHVEIGRRLWRKLSSVDLDRHLFVILSQFNMGYEVIKRENERTALANLCFHAGKKAAKLSSFRTACVYLNLGIHLLGDRCWRDEYELTLALHDAAAEMELCSANYKRVNALLDAVFEHARGLHDKIQAYTTKIYAVGIVGTPQESIDIGLDVLKQLGETFPSKLGNMVLMFEFRKAKEALKGMNNDEILRLPTIGNEKKLACLKILQLISFRAMVARPLLGPLITLRMMRLTLHYGLSAFSSLAFASYGALCLAATDRFDDAFRFGELALELLDKFEAKEYLARVYTFVYGAIWPWKRPIVDVLEPLMYAHRVAFQTGDTEFSCLTKAGHVFLSFEAGIPLNRIGQGLSDFHESMLSTKQLSTLRLILPTMQMIHHFMGLSEEPLSLQGDLIHWKDFIEECRKHDLGMLSAAVGMSRLLLAYVFIDYELASTLFSELRKEMFPKSVERVSIEFVGGMTVLAMARMRKNYRKNILLARRAIRMIDGLADDCPHLCLDRLLLLKAEMASVRGQTKKAFQMYLCAIALAHERKSLFTCALANERFARHLCERREWSMAKTYFLRACDVYGEWGAKAKVVRLRAEVATIYREDFAQKGHELEQRQT